MDRVIPSSSGASLNQVLGRANQERGRANESRVLEAFLDPGAEKPPEWFYAVRLASRAEDSRGIDIIVRTDVGDVFVQVKSSSRSAESFYRNRRKNPHIKVVIVTEKLSAKKIRETVFSVVSQERKWVMWKRWKDRINWFPWLNAA